MEDTYPAGEPFLISAVIDSPRGKTSERCLLSVADWAAILTGSDEW